MLFWDEPQGYLFSRPLTMQDAEELIRANQPLGPKRALNAAAEDCDVYYSSKPFEWPELAPL